MGFSSNAFRTMTLDSCLALYCPANSSFSESEYRMNKQRIAIIGGGPGGLMTAYRLQQRTAYPCDVTIYEATGRLGGKVVTNQFQSAPVRYEAGAAELYDYSRLGPDPLRELIDELGLKTREM